MAEKKGCIRKAAAVLVHPNAKHFGTGHRTNSLKTIINCFLNARCPLRVRIPLFIKQKNSQKAVSCLAEKKGCIRKAAAVLVHPNAKHFGTGHRTNSLKTIINCFLNARCPLRVRIPLFTKQKNSQKAVSCLAEKKGFEPLRRLTRPNGLANRPLRPTWVLLRI